MINSPNFIDLFSGCGGLSLGLTAAGWRGVFAVEKDKYAFESLRANLVDGNSSTRSVFDWPKWLPKEAMLISDLLRNHPNELAELVNGVDLIAGGPPCQGFSMSGQRLSGDPRNKLFRSYIKVVKAVQPKLLVIENVLGMSYKFNGHHDRPIRFSDKLKAAVRRAGYKAYSGVLKASDFGVPQSRPRFFMIGVRRDLVRPGLADPFKLIEENRKKFLSVKGLPVDRPVTVGEAIGDLTSSAGLEPSDDSPGFMQTIYAGPQSHYQSILHRESKNGAPNSRRIANHRPNTVDRFKLLQATGVPGKRISRGQLSEMGLKKHTVWFLSENMPSPTLTTLPDDMLHYSEPRIPTVREMARLQSFPDWFEFQGKYTTGGTMRTQECPRFTQVGNAVAPFVAESVGSSLIEYLSNLPTD